MPAVAFVEFSYFHRMALLFPRLHYKCIWFIGFQKVYLLRVAIIYIASIVLKLIHKKKKELRIITVLQCRTSNSTIYTTRLSSNSQLPLAWNLLNF